ncbi:hypothetical protein Tco_1167532, partial [Tanacetum coccineum]
QGSLYHTVDNDGVLDRLKFISKGEEHQVYGKPIPDILVTDDMKNSEAYKTFISISKILIPPKKGRGKGAQGTKATVIPKKETSASKKKRAKKIEFSDEESDEQEERLIRRKHRGVIIQDTLQVTKKKSIDQTQKLKGIELLSDAAQFEIDTQKAIKANKRESRCQHQSGGSNSDKGAGTSPEVPDEIDDEEDDASIDIEKTNDERTDTDVEDQLKGAAEMNIVEEAEEELLKELKNKRMMKSSRLMKSKKEIIKMEMNK